MRLKHSLDRDMEYGRGLDRDVIHKEVGDKLQEGKNLEELAARFVSDKEKLESEIQKVQNAKISEKDKNALIAQLNDAISQLQEQYETEVAEEQEKVQETLEGKIEAMQEAALELERQEASLRSVQMDAASTDTSAAADTALEQKREFESMKQEYAEKLKLQVEQAEIQRRNIRNRQFGGR